MSTLSITINTNNKYPLPCTFKPLYTLSIFKFWLYVLTRVHVYVPCSYRHPEARRGWWIPRNWSYQWLWAIENWLMWVLGIGPMSLSRAAGAPNHKVTSPSPVLKPCWEKSLIQFYRHCCSRGKIISLGYQLSSYNLDFNKSKIFFL